MTLHNDHRPTIRQRRTWLFAAPTVVIAFALMAACGAADPHIENEDEPLFGYVRALVNGEPWESTGHRAQATIRYGLPIITFNAEYVDEALYPWSDRFGISHPIESTILISTNDINVRPAPDGRPDRYGFVYFELNGPDAIIGVSYAIEDEHNLLRVDYYDDESGVIEGVFEATLVADFKHPLAVRPDTFRITEGEFRLLLEDHR